MDDQMNIQGVNVTSTATQKQSWFSLVGFFVAGIILASILSYLTPLRDIRVVPPEIKKIEATAFYDAYQKTPDEYYFVDVRPAFLRFEYPENAVNKSIFSLSELFVEFPRDKTIVLFCEEGISAAVAAGFLKFEGFRDVYVIDGGRVKWKEAGLPLVRNENYNKEAEGFLDYFKEGGLLPKTKL